MPTNQINYNDDLSQVTAKQTSQEVRRSLSHTECSRWYLPAVMMNNTKMLLFTHSYNFFMSLQRVMDDLKRKGDDMDRVADLSLDLQNLLNVRIKCSKCINVY